MNINFFMPTKVVMVEDCIRKNISLLKIFGSRALIVTGAQSARMNGALQDITEALDSEGIQYAIFDKVMANPTIACVFEGAEYATKFNAELVIGIGGGSPMDAAKVIALLATQQVSEEELFLGKFVDQALPLVLIPTTAGTGSEVTPYAILTNEKSQTKTSISASQLFPKLALLDAKYMRSLSITTTINTAIDALTHAIEGMLTVRSNEMSDYFAIESIKKLVPCLRSLSPEKGQESINITMDIREKLLYGSMLAGIVITHTGTTVVHAMGYSLTYFKNVDHGRANGLILPSFLRFIMKNDQEVIKKILAATGMESLDEFEALFLRLLGESEQVTEQEVEKFAGITMNAKSINNTRAVLSKEDIIKLYYRSLKIR